MGIKNYNINPRGFTIIELLIVVSIIAILATISTISYGAIQNKTKTNALKSDLAGAASQLAADLYAKNAYPATLAAAANGDGVKISNDATMTYTVNNSANPKTYCITGTNGTIVWKVDQTSAVTQGACGDAPVVDPPVVTPPADPVPPVYTASTNAIGVSGSKNLSITPSSTIPDGSWMIASITAVNDGTFTAPSGWTLLFTKQTVGTLTWAVYGKIKSSSDSTPYTFTTSADQTAANMSIMWGTGTTDVSNWTIGAVGTRAALGTSYTNVAPGISAPAKSLVLSLSAERTTAAESNVSSISNASAVYFMAQTGSAQIQTLSVSSTSPSSATSTSSVTITYPNTQSVNGMALQIALPAVTP